MIYSRYLPIAPSFQYSLPLIPRSSSWNFCVDMECRMGSPCRHAQEWHPTNATSSPSYFLDPIFVQHHLLQQPSSWPTCQSTMDSIGRAEVSYFVRGEWRETRRKRGMWSERWGEVRWGEVRWGEVQWGAGEYEENTIDYVNKIYELLMALPCLRWPWKILPLSLHPLSLMHASAWSIHPFVYLH